MLLIMLLFLVILTPALQGSLAQASTLETRQKTLVTIPEYDAAKHRRFPDLHQQFFRNQESSGNKGVLTCTLCRQVMNSAINWNQQGLTDEEIITRLTNLCTDYTPYNERVCRGVIEINYPTFEWITKTRNASGSPLSPDDVCGFMLYPDCNLEGFDWTLNLDFLGTKPIPEDPQIPPEGSPTMKILQLTDVHLDPNYAPGYNAECVGETTCCRMDQGIPINSSAAAGYWGDYRLCDSPIHAFDNLVQEVATRHQDIAYVIFTGDIVDHAIWATSEQYNTDMITYVENTFRTYFPSVPVINIFGNHESHPCDLFSDPRKTEIPANLTQDWLYTLAADLWSPWLPPETRPDILAGGMFAVEVQPGLVVIGINTMFCYMYNWWIMYDNVDPAGELMWLANKLLEVETAGKKAHILAHHPMGHDDCMHMWSSQYRRIVDRFENTLVAQFHGHTHNDHFAVFYDLNDTSRPTSVSFTAGSGTPFSLINPNYRVYTIDANPTSYRVLDHETWYYNLTEANLAGATVLPNWQLMYSFNNAYGTPAPFPHDMDDLVHRMVNDTVLQDQYWRYHEKLGDASLALGCDEICMQHLMCETVITVFGDNTKCNELYPV